MASLLLPTNVRVRNTHTTIDIWFPIRNNTETLISLAPYLSGTHLPSQLCARTGPTPSELGLGRPRSALARNPPPWASYSATRTLIIDPDPDPEPLPEPLLWFMTIFYKKKKFLYRRQVPAVPPYQMVPTDQVPRSIPNRLSYWLPTSITFSTCPTACLPSKDRLKST